MRIGSAHPLTIYSDTLVCVNSLRNFSFTHIVKQGNSVAHTLVQRVHLSFFIISLDGECSVLYKFLCYCWFFRFLIKLIHRPELDSLKKKKNIGSIFFFFLHLHLNIIIFILSLCFSLLICVSSYSWTNPQP